jgi:hypothetical protein
VVLLGVFAALVASASGSPQRAEYRFRQVASGFDQPVYLAQPKSEPGRLYVVERPGRIVTLAGGKRRTFLDIRSRVESGYSEQGLLSVAFHPGYAKNHLVLRLLHEQDRRHRDRLLPLPQRPRACVIA